MTTPISQPTDTPCVGVCSTIYGDLICRGCKRFYDEIIDWNTYEDSKKLEVLNRLNRLKTETVQDYLEVIDAQLLKAKCRHHKIRIREEFTPYIWLMQGYCLNPIGFPFLLKPFVYHQLARLFCRFPAIALCRLAQ